MTADVAVHGAVDGAVDGAATTAGGVRDPFVHPAALCESDQVGPGTRVWAFAHVLPGAVIGADCNICDHAFVESEVRLGDRVTVKNNVALFNGLTVENDVFLGPNAVFTNDYNPRAAVKKTSDDLLPTVIRSGATIGANATIVCGVTIGENAFIGAGTVVIRDVPPGAMVVGNPARHIGWMCACGERLGDDLTCSCGTRHRADSASGGVVTDHA
ncbi:acyltransferase [Parafrankia sp. EUN1f]|uniref:acyltransferase n=1 Tax=Parafrankia sp. EUN1f TaxID=102897 RepID=UPI0001C468A9|nr:acyltransferase [Parafrankia sp. EUN1f]EFC80587.1 transferase hexapeptide repeat containing protein [Parafrankia sp. EUN1f]